MFAGTFDHLHEGHKHLLRRAFQLGSWVGIGLTTNEMLSDKAEAGKIQSFEERRKALMDFIRSESQTARCTVFTIKTREGGAETMEDLEALIVSDEIGVVANAFQINEMRARNGLRRFDIIVVPRVRTEDGIPLSSSRVRRGETLDHRKLVY